MADVRDKLKFAAARAAGASRSSAALRPDQEPTAIDENAVSSRPVDDATITLAMVDPADRDAPPSAAP